MLDCLIIGGGPAGLTAAIYLARFRRDALLIDAGQSRAGLIPSIHNYPGFSDLNGRELLDRLRRQAEDQGARLLSGQVHDLTLRGETFMAASSAGRLMARTTILATGLQDRHPPIDGWERDGGYAGPIRFCPICDGFEALDKRIGVLGGNEAACRKAIFMRTYSQYVTLFATHRIDVKSACKLDEAGIQLVRLPCAITRVENSVLVATDDGSRHEVDVLYPAMGSHVNSGIASALGAKCDETGLIKVDEHQLTNVEGLYAVGDVVTDLHQIIVGTAHAAVAATAVHNRLPPNPR